MTPRTLHLAAFAALLTAALALTSCQGTKEITLPQPDVQEQSRAAEPRELTVLSFVATVEGMSVSGQVRLAQDSVIWFSATKIVELGRAMATVDSVWVNAPLANKRYAGDYADISRRVKQPVTFQSLQAIANAPNAEHQIEDLARQMGIDATVRITARRRVEQLSFPFVKP